MTVLTEPEKMETTTNDGVKKVKSTRKNRVNQIILLSALAIILNAVLSHSLSNSPDLVKVGDRLPEFSVTSSGGEELGLSFIKGEPALIYFFAEWCPCSHESIGFVKRAEDEFAENGLKIIAIGIQDRAKNLTAFAKKHELKFPVSLTGGDDVARALGVKTTPTSLFVDRQGIVKAIHIGKIEQYKDISVGLELITQNNDAVTAQG